MEAGTDVVQMKEEGGSQGWVGVGQQQQERVHAQPGKRGGAVNGRKGKAAAAVPPPPGGQEAQGVGRGAGGERAVAGNVRKRRGAA